MAGEDMMSSPSSSRGAAAASPGGGRFRDEFDLVKHLAEEQSRELQIVASRVADLSIGRVAGLRQELQQSHEQVAVLEQRVSEASHNARHLSIYAAHARHEADQAQAERLLAEDKLDDLRGELVEAVRSERSSTQKAEAAERVLAETEVKLTQSDKRLKEQTETAARLRAELMVERREHAAAVQSHQQQLAEKEREADDFRFRLDRAQETTRLTARQLEEAKEEAQAAAVRASEETRALQDTIGRVQQAAGDSAREKHKLQQKLEKERQEKESMAQSFQSLQKRSAKDQEDASHMIAEVKNNLNVLLQQMADTEAELQRARRAAAEAKMRADSIAADKATVERRAEALEEQCASAGEANAAVRAELTQQQQEHMVMAEDLQRAQRHVALLRVSNETFQSDIAAMRDELQEIGQLRQTVASLESQTKCLRGDRQHLEACSLSELLEYASAVSGAQAKINDAILQARLADAQSQLSVEASQCSICVAHPRNTALNCGHVFCDRCSQRISQCPVCRADILQRTRLFV